MRTPAPTRAPAAPVAIPESLRLRVREQVGATVALLQELNREGITIVLVTHEQDISAWASRRIVFRDGRIVEEIRQQPVRPAPAEAQA